MSQGQVKPMYFPQVVFLGDKGVGKTSLIQRLMDNEASQGYQPGSGRPTIANEYLEKQMMIGRSSQKILAGVKLYDSNFTLTTAPPSLSRRRDIIVVVWSLYDAQSYMNMNGHMDEVTNMFINCQMQSRPDIIICANKSDSSRLNDQFKTCREKHRKSFHVIRTSALDGTGIQELLDCIATLLYARYSDGQKSEEIEGSINLSVREQPSTGSGPEPNCC